MYVCVCNVEKEIDNSVEKGGAFGRDNASVSECNLYAGTVRIYYREKTIV